MRKRPGTGVSAFGFCSVRALVLVITGGTGVRCPSLKGNLFKTHNLLDKLVD